MPPWRIKAVLQRGFSALPAGHRLNYVFQRHVTRGVPISERSLDAAVDLAAGHLARLEQHATTPVREGRFFEFGAGWDLHVPQILWCMGVDQQLVVDIRPLLREDLVVDIARRLAATPRPELERVPPTSSGLAEHLDALAIDYRAPLDARATGLPDGSIDVVTSSNTLEHIPPADIAAILTETARILAPDGLMSFNIDYRDHFSYFDPTISIYNFLRFDEPTWQRRYSPDLHFQNRLRHDDHLELIRQAGLVVVDEETQSGDDAAQEDLRALPLADPFRGRDLDRLAICGSQLILRKP